MFPEELVKKCILLGSRPGDIVLDPFAGSGCAGLVAQQLGRNSVLIEISDVYVGMMQRRVSDASGGNRSEGSGAGNRSKCSTVSLATNVKPERVSPKSFLGMPETKNQTQGQQEQGTVVISGNDGAIGRECAVESNTPLEFNGGARVVNSEFVEWAAAYAGSKFHAVLSDIPYGYHLMGESWDDPRQATKNQVHNYLPPGQRMTTVGENIEYQNAVRKWGEAMLPMLYPGALVMMFAGPRMWEWVATGMQMAGFEHWETINWIHAQGFPKALDISKEVDKKFGKESEAWSGYKTPALKPSFEPILCFRAPRAGMTYAELAHEFGTGALNVDAGRIGTGAKKWDKPKGGIWRPGEPGQQRWIVNPLGRFPANVILDEESAIMLDQQSGLRVSRFFFCPKPSKREREIGCEDLPIIVSGMSNGAQAHGEGYDKGQDIGLNRVIPRKNDHPCVKPLALCRYLASLLLPPASVAPARRLLVPFCGSGSEIIGALQAGWDEVVGVEQNAHFCEIANRRIEYWRRIPVPAVLAESRLHADLDSLN